MIPPTWFIGGFLLPALIVAAVVAVTALVGGRTLAVGWALGVAAGFVVGFHATTGWPAVPPRESHQWLLVVLLPVAVVVTALAVGPGVPRWLPWGLRVAVAFGGPAVLLQSYLRYTWSMRDAAVWLVGLGMAWLVLWALLMRLSPRRSVGAALPWALVLVAGATGLTIALSGSQTLGQYGLALAGALAGGAAVATLWRRALPAVGAIDVATVLLAGLWLNGVFYAELTWLNAALLAVSPAMLWLGEVGPFRGGRPWRQVTARLVGVAVPAGLAVALAALAFAREMAQAGGGYGY